ncbi:Multidrug export protein mepA [uncultured Clostridium sp.]|nr:Multidrug export protein mepA [uncultured Clostridium sp.]
MSYSIAILVVIMPLLKKSTVVNIFKGNFDKSTIWPVIYNGSSEGVTAIAIATTAYVFNMAFMKIAGEIGIAAFTSISYISQFGTLIMFGISDGIGLIVSYNYGYKEFGRVEEVLKISYKVTLSVGIFLFFVLFLFGKNLVGMFAGGNKDVLDMAIEGSKIYACTFFFNGFNIVYSGYFTAIGKAKESIVISACRGIVFIIIGIFILPMILNLNGVWLTIPFAELMTFLVGTKMMNINKFTKKVEALV